MQKLIKRTRVFARYTNKFDEEYFVCNEQVPIVAQDTFLVVNFKINRIVSCCRIVLQVCLIGLEAFGLPLIYVFCIWQQRCNVHRKYTCIRIVLVCCNLRKALQVFIIGCLMKLNDTFMTAHFEGCMKGRLVLNLRGANRNNEYDNEYCRYLVHYCLTSKPTKLFVAPKLVFEYQICAICLLSTWWNLATVTFTTIASHLQ